MTYSNHQKKAAQLASREIELSASEILIVGATMQPTITTTAQGRENFERESKMSVAELSQHLLSECRRYRSSWKDILGEED